MRFLFCYFFFTTLIYSCSPKITSTIKSQQLPLSEKEVVLVLQKEDNFNNDGIEIGSIKSGDNGFSTNCSYYEIIDRLKQLARQKGANVLKITKHKSPDQWSSCERITAKIYRVPNFRMHEKEIQWTAHRKLAWEDFKGTPDYASNVNTAALSYCGFGFRTNRVTMFKKTKIFISTTFTTNLSWVRPDQENRQDLLQHEQGHFDLCELYARILRKRLEEKNLTVFNLNIEANVIFKDVYASYIVRQELYDNETQHGLDCRKQIEWTNQIESELGNLNAFTQ